MTTTTASNDSWYEDFKAQRERDEKRNADLDQKSKETLEWCRQFSAEREERERKQAALQAKINGILGASQEFDAKWKSFSDRFDKVLRGLLTGSGMMGLPQLGEFIEPSSDDKAQILDGGDCTLEAIARGLSRGAFKRVVVCAGAGISVAAGIPDFRTKGTGLYDNLSKYNLPSPQSVFDISFFGQNPQPFFDLAKELYPGGYEPTQSHRLVKLLADKGVLLRCYTQNIDCLERRVGLPEDLLVEAHGSFHTATCRECQRKFVGDEIRSHMVSGRVVRCADIINGGDGDGHASPTDAVPKAGDVVASECGGTQAPSSPCRCPGIVKPDIVFFGESLPARFHELHKCDMESCDLLIVMGTSLQVQPFASLPHMVGPACPRLLINREPVLVRTTDEQTGERSPFGFRFGDDDNYRDVAYLGNCDDGAEALARLCKWQL